MRTDKRNEAKSGPDWAAIRAEYENTTKPIRELARWFSLSDTAIRKKLKAEGWERRKSPEGSQQPEGCEPNPLKAAVTPLVAAAAVDTSAIVDRGRNVVSRLLEELELLGEPSILDMIKNEIAKDTKDDQNSRRRTIMLKAVSFPTRAAAIKNLANALRSLLETGNAGKKEKKREAAGAVAAGGDEDWGDLLTPGTAPN